MIRPKADSETGIVTLQGKVTLQQGFDPKKPPLNAVIGNLTVKGRTYLLKMQYIATGPVIGACDGKMSTVIGRLRNSGKYLLIQYAEPVQEFKSRARPAATPDPAKSGN